MNEHELRLNLYITQGIIIAVSILLSYLFFHDLFKITTLFHWDPFSIFILGGGTGLCIILLDAIFTKFLPDEWMDDGGINERVFQNINIIHLFFLTLLIGFCEELLFRGIIQEKFGIAVASFIFAVLHIRYLKQPFLFIFVLLISVMFGYLFDFTGNLLVTVFAHFLVDFIMGFHLRITMKGEDNA